MTVTEWYVIDTRTNEIVNCITSSDSNRVELVLGSFVDAEFLRLDPNPPRALLERYRYWNERP